MSRALAALLAVAGAVVGSVAVLRLLETPREFPRPPAPGYDQV